MNLPTHGHGQGYTDLNFMIPELVERIDYPEGPLLRRRRRLLVAPAPPTSTTSTRFRRASPSVEGGMFHYDRVLLAARPAIGEGNLLDALELLHDNGPWEVPDRYQEDERRAALQPGRRRVRRQRDGVGLRRQVERDRPDRAARARRARASTASIRSTRATAANSQKYMLYGEWHRRNEDSADALLVYGFYQDLDLWSNFTYSSTARRAISSSRRTAAGWAAARPAHTCTAQLVRLRDGEHRRSPAAQRQHPQRPLPDRAAPRTDKIDWDGNLIPGTTRRDDVWELSLAPYVENRIQWFEKLRSIVGVRLDYFHFDVDASDRPGAPAPTMP